MGIEQLKAALEKEAALKEEAVRVQAKEDAARIAADAEAKVRELDRLIAKRRIELKTKADYLQESLRKMAERENAARREDTALRALHNRALELFCDFMNSDGYAPFVNESFTAAVRETGSVDTVTADAETARILANITSSPITVDDAVGHGFAITGGAVTVIATFEVRLESVWRRTASEFVNPIVRLLDHAL